MRLRIRPLVAAIAALASSAAFAGTIEFLDEAPVPRTDAEKRAILTATRAVVDGMPVNISYHLILRSGQRGALDPNGYRFGQLYDIQGRPLVAEDGSPYISNDNDFSSLLRGRRDGKLYMVSHFESRPGAIYLTELAQDPQNGRLTALRTRPLDLSPFNGGWVHCAGSVTPWGTHLGSEEYEPDAKQWRDNKISDYNAAMAAYFGATPAEAGSVMNPYDYGWPIEVVVDDYNNVSVQKHYAMGRIALELGYVMPDGKTVYLSDDGTNVGLFRFVANRPGDLSAGALWVAQWNQKESSGAGVAKLNWIYLGWATDDEVREWVRRYRFTDIFDEAEPVAAEGGKYTCPEGFTSINAGHDDGSHQCLRLRDINGDGVINWRDENIASRLETRRWAAMQGGTTEFRKMEGMTYDPDRNQLYVAMSEIDRGMLDFGRAGRPPKSYDKYDRGGPNHMRLDQANVCGGVYALHLDGNFTAIDMYPLIVGRPLTMDYGASANLPEYDGINKCDVNGIANPDNITYIPRYDTLIIGEDTGDGHQNDMIWAYNLRSGRLTRLQTTPYGSETTSPYIYPNINGFAYLMSVVQHPYGESDEDKLEEPGQLFGYTGYFVFPALDK